MLKRLRVNNFKSLVNVEFQPAGVNLLIGRNNSGKTNLCAAMRFLGLTASSKLEKAVRRSLGETWNIANVYSGGDTIEIEAECSLPYEQGNLEFEYSLHIGLIQGIPPGKQSFEIAREILTVTGGRFEHQRLVERDRNQLILLNEKRYIQVLANLPDGLPQIAANRGQLEWDEFSRMKDLASDETALSRVRDFENTPRCSLFRQYLESWAYYSFSPGLLRSPDVVRNEPGLLPTGANLARSLFFLHNEKPRSERKIIEMVRTLEPKLDLLTYSFPDPESVYLFMEDQEGHRFGTQSISDGTVRFMAMTYLILAAERDEKQPAPLIIIEEPENGLYVGHLKPLIERIDKEGKGGQFIFTTHSPYFIDLFDGMLEGVHLMKPGVPSSTLTKPNPDKIRKLLEVMSLGEMHFREMLG